LAGGFPQPSVSAGNALLVLASTHLALQGGWLFVRDYGFLGASLKEPFPSSPQSFCLAAHTQSDAQHALF